MAMMTERPIITSYCWDWMKYPGQHEVSYVDSPSKEHKNMFEERIDIWLSSKKKDSVPVLQALLKGVQARKATTVKRWKQEQLDKAHERVQVKKEEKQKLLDRIKELEDENKSLKEQLNGTSRDTSIKLEVEEILHQRQVHHLRGKLISNKIISNMPSVATQTDISTVSTSGFYNWCTTNMDTVDGVPEAIPINNLNKKVFNIIHKPYNYINSN